MKIVVTGTRGIPDILGGVETHCEKLYPRLAAMGHDITVVRRTPYVKSDRSRKAFRGVRLADVYAPRLKSIEAIVHTFLAILKARTMNPDILHIHAVGPSLLAPFARLLGLKVVTTNHGPDYDRQKWGRIAKTVLKLGERAGAVFSNRTIVISTTIADILKNNYGTTNTALIYNGVELPQKSCRTDFLTQWGVGAPYITAIGRFVEEKGFHDLIRAFSASKASATHQLVIAGDSDHPDRYSTELKQLAKDNNVILTGFIKGEPLNQLMSHASLFVLPSYHEGLPIALLEAMSYGLNVAVSDIPANRLAALEATDFFPAGDVGVLSALIDRKLSAPQATRAYDLSPFNWDNIAAQTEAVYREVAAR